MSTFVEKILNSQLWYWQPSFGSGGVTPDPEREKRIAENRERERQLAEERQQVDAVDLATLDPSDISVAISFTVRGKLATHTRTRTITLSELKKLL